MNKKTHLILLFTFISTIIFGKNSYYPINTISDSLLQIFISTQDVLCKGENTGQISIDSILGGTPPYEVEWSTGDNALAVNSLYAATYHITITDNIGSTLDTTVVVEEPENALELSLMAEEPYCIGQYVTIYPSFLSGGTEPYSFLWNNGNTGFTVFAQGGTYSLTVTDANGCTASDTASINVPVCDFTLHANINNVTCNGGSDGSVSLGASGVFCSSVTYCGEGTYSSSNTFFPNLQAGVYSFSAFTEYCSSSITVTIDEPLAHSSNFNIEVIDIDCNNEFGNTSINQINNSSSYNILWEDGSTSFFRDSLAEGLYAITISDENQCDYLDYLEIRKHPIAKLQDSIIIEVNCDSPNTPITLEPIIQDTNSNYIYTWLNEYGDTLLNNNSFSTIVESGGNYTLIVTDTLENCSNVAQTELKYIEPKDSSIVENLFSENILCIDSSIFLNPYIDTSNYPLGKVQWLDYKGNIISDSLIVEISEPGMYVLQIQNLESSCYNSIETKIIINDTIYSNPVIEPTTMNHSYGQIVPFISGGIKPYSYNWSNGGFLHFIRDLPSDTYSLTVTDAIGCTAIFDYEVGTTTSTNAVIKEKEISIFPNPNNGNFSFNCENCLDSFSKIEIINQMGQKVKEFDQLLSQKIEVNNLSSGIYFINLYLNDGTHFSDKIVVR